MAEFEHSAKSVKLLVALRLNRKAYASINKFI